jgi:hypothetical protein
MNFVPNPSMIITQKFYIFFIKFIEKSGDWVKTTHLSPIKANKKIFELKKSQMSILSIRQFINIIHKHIL